MVSCDRKIVDKAVEVLLSSTFQSAADSWRTSKAVDTVVSELRVAQLMAQLLIERSECWRLPKYHPIDEVLSQLKDSVYETQSIVDELEYQRWKNKVKKRFPGILRVIENWWNDSPTTVKRVLDRLNDVYDKLKILCDSHGIPENPNQFSKPARPNTARFIDPSTVYGREKELNEVIRLMGVPSSESREMKRAKIESVSNSNIGESSSRMEKNQNVSVVSIVGMGGVGKTTIAQLVCHESSVQNYFHPIMWVCVSHNSDLGKLTEAIIEGATMEGVELTSLDVLQGTLQKALYSKRFLLVLDDIWTKDWQRLLLPMNEASQGSVVLVTTRSLDCVKMPGTSIGSRGVINLEGFEKDISWEFLMTCVFDSVAKSNNINPDLEVIGKQICDKLQGSPLAAKKMGDVLKKHLDVTHWTNIKNSKMWQLQEDQDDILPVLALSYQYLPSHLKKCFLFCSLYPKGFKFTQSELTVFWIMQDLIKPLHNIQQPLHNIQQLRTQAECYFADLVRRGCFFQKLAHGAHGENDESIHDENIEYVIHELMRNVCQSITRDECFCLENGQSEPEVSPDIRHLSEFRDELTLEGQTELCKYTKLVSLKVAPGSSCYTAAIENWCTKLTNLRSLSLARCEIIELPKNIGNLKHLHCLDISGAKVQILPESFCILYNLQYLDMNDCSDIRCFPERFNNLVNLIHFRLPLEKVPLVEPFENVFKALQLYDLEVDVVPQKIENLKKKLKLSGSLKIIDLQKFSSKNAAEEAQLNQKPLNRLDLVWSQRSGHTGDQSVSNEDHDEEILHGLCPHRNLQELRITHYEGRDLSPSWLKELPNLTEVLFEKCEKASTISHLPRFITKLSVVGCAQLINLQNCLEPNHLPVLEHIRIIRCRELKSLPVESFGGFVFLKWLTIKYCPKLGSSNAMVLPPSVKGLELRSCGDLEKSIPGCLQNLTSLETLSISDNQHLKYIRAEVASNLKSLSELHFVGCTKLQSLGGLQFLASLQKVTIRSCPMLDETRGQDINGKLPSELLEDVPSSSQDQGQDQGTRSREILTRSREILTRSRTRQGH